MLRMRRVPPPSVRFLARKGKTLAYCSKIHICKTVYMNLTPQAYVWDGLVGRFDAAAVTNCTRRTFHVHRDPRFDPVWGQRGASVTGTKIVGAGLILAASICPVLGSASAQDAGEQQAMNNVQAEMTTCVAFYAIETQCLRLRNRPREDAQLIQGTSAAKDRLQNQAGEIGIALGITPDAMVSRLSNEITSMKALIKDSCINIASLPAAMP
jgi:hypothetical protein